MRTVRVYDNQPLQLNSQVTLGSDAFNHAIKVLRMEINDPLTVFNGDGNDYQAVITSIQKKSADIRVTGIQKKDNESPIRIHLGQVLSRGDKMDFTVQKSVELGVNVITPLVSERCGVKLNDERSQKKQETLQKIVISACEQCGRAVIPEVRPLMSLEEASRFGAGLCMVSAGRSCSMLPAVSLGHRKNHPERKKERTAKANNSLQGSCSRCLQLFCW